LENRILVAFVLSLVVFFGWGYFLSTVQPPPKPVEELAQNSNASATGKSLTNKSSSSSAGASSSNMSSTGTSSAPSPIVPETDRNEETVDIATGLATFTLSNKGGVIKSIILAKYKGDTGEIVDLVKHEPGAKLPLTLETQDSAFNAILANAYYQISPAKNVTLSASNPQHTVTVTYNGPDGLNILRKITFTYGKYTAQVETTITNPAMAGRNLDYYVLLGPGMGGAVSSQTDFIVFSGATTFVNNERVESPPDEIEGDFKEFKGDISWTAFQNKYFTTALIPERGTKSTIVKKEGENVYVGLKFESVQSAASAGYMIYSGTKELQLLEDTGHKLVRVLDYGWVGNKFAFLVKPLLKALQYFYGIFQNYGWAIIALTFVIKLLFFPLTHKSFKSMKGMHKVQPYVKMIQERNKDDRQKMNEELMELYKKHRVNPLGGCLPMLLQIPVFIGLYHALFFSIELRGAPFIWWIKDLSVADPYYVTPILMGISMFLQQKMSPAIGDPVQQKIMMFLPVFFTFLFVSFPAGLVIYWTINNVLTISQQYYIYKIAKD